jgi:hypothetical protein
VRLSVLGPAVSWHQDASPSQVESYVGCTSRIVVRAQDCSRSPPPACRGVYEVYIRPLSLPQRAQVMSMLPCLCILQSLEKKKAKGSIGMAGAGARALPGARVTRLGVGA